MSTFPTAFHDAAPSWDVLDAMVKATADGKRLHAELAERSAGGGLGDELLPSICHASETLQRCVVVDPATQCLALTASLKSPLKRPFRDP